MSPTPLGRTPYNREPRAALARLAPRLALPRADMLGPFGAVRKQAHDGAAEVLHSWVPISFLASSSTLAALCCEASLVSSAPKGPEQVSPGQSAAATAA